MKRIFALMTVLAALMLSSCGEKPAPTPGPDQGKWKDTFNGELVIALSDAYDGWIENNTMPTSVIWEGLKISASEYVRAGITLILKMIDSPEDWYKEDLVYPNATFGLSSNEDAFLPREVPFTAFEQLLRNQYKSMVEDRQVIISMTIPGYEPILASRPLAVMICRTCHAYVKDGKFPDTIDTWDVSYLHSTTNCNINSDIVKGARDAAWKAAGVTEASTDREKAVAIFNYARDNWTWENYNNSRKGADGTITAKAGNCCDLSNAIVAMCRLSGIPARYFHAQCHYSSGYIGHVISQPFVDGQWWMADASNDSNSFGTVTFTDYTGLHYYEDLYF